MKKSRGITGIILTVLIVYATLSLAAAQKDLNEACDLTAQLGEKVAEASAENEKLLCDLENISSEEAKESLARERLGLVKPNEILFIDIN